MDVSPTSYAYKVIDMNLRNLIMNYRDILPMRKPKIIVRDLKDHDASHMGSKFEAGGLYDYGDKLIYIDKEAIDDPEILEHEYAHY